LQRATSLDDSPNASRAITNYHRLIASERGNTNNNILLRPNGGSSHGAGAGVGAGTTTSITLGPYSGLSISTANLTSFSSSSTSSSTSSDPQITNHQNILHSLAFPDDSPSPSPTASGPRSPQNLQYTPALFTLDRPPSFLEDITSSNVQTFVSSRHRCIHKIGEKFDVLDTADKWVGGVVVDTRMSTVLRPHETRPIQQVFIHYEG
jgi:hypothetical protein